MSAGAALRLVEGTSVDKTKALDAAVSQIERQFRQGLHHAPRRQQCDGSRNYSTGSLALDLALGVGGLPRGRVTEIFGPESSGKTTLALHVIAEAQRMGGIAAYIDAEHALDPLYATSSGSTSMMF